MLTRVHIVNFRLCRDVELDNAGPVVALIGKNGAGKSNILQAIWAGARAASSTEPIAVSEVLGRFGLSITLEFALPEGSFRYQVATQQTQARSPDFIEDLSRRSNGTWVSMAHREAGTVQIPPDRVLKIGEFTSMLPTIATILPSSEPAVADMRPALSFLSSVRYYPLDEPGTSGVTTERFIEQKDYEKWATTHETTGADPGNVVQMRIVHMSQKRQEDFETLKQLLGPGSLGLIDTIVVNTLKVTRQSSTGGPAQEENVYYITYVPHRGPQAGPMFSVPYDALSLGTRRIVRLLTSMLFDRSSVMLLEQPEDSLHQGMTKKVIDILRSNASPAQLFLASHSSALMNKLKPEEIRLVTLHNGFTQVRPLTDNERLAAINFMNEEGTLYDFVSPLEDEEEEGAPEEE
jgi:ABC-type Na+ transport system ATPase subunit NatA